MIVNRRHFLAGAALAALPLPLRAAAPSRLEPSAIQADLDLLLRAFGAVHPGLTRYLPPGGFADRIAAAKGWGAMDRSPSEMFVMLARLAASVRCGHTYPNPNNQRRAARAAFFDGRDRVPFAFRWIGRRMIVTGARGVPVPIAAGSEILALDGLAPSRLLDRMLPLARADGGNDRKREAQMGIDPRERFAAFDVYRPMLMRVRGDGTVRARVRGPGGSERRVDLPALTESELEASRPDGGATLGWTFNVGGDGIGLLTMPTWTTYRSDWDWKGFLDSAADRLIDEKAKGLIVDLRGNEGGTECGWHLLERPVESETVLPAFVRRTRYRSLPPDLAGPLDTWNPAFRDWGAAAAGPDPGGWYRLERPGADVTRISPRGRRYAGPMAVLVDSSCSSATFQFANALKAGRIAPLVGEPTGGNRRGLNGDGYFFVRLPGSGLEVDLPIVGMFAATPQPDAGVVPDVRVPLMARDIAAGLDRQMEAARRLVRGTRS